MEVMRESWTDDRLDYLNHRVDDGFKRMELVGFLTILATIL
jgi:hypothetical protein